MRVILKTFRNNITAEAVAARLRDLDLPIVVMRSDFPAEIFGNLGEWEVWLEDETILENEAWRKQIEDVLSQADAGLTPEEEEEIAKMPPVDS